MQRSKRADGTVPAVENSMTGIDVSIGGRLGWRAEDGQSPPAFVPNFKTCGSKSSIYPKLTALQRCPQTAALGVRGSDLKSRSRNAMHRAGRTWKSTLMMSVNPSFRVGSLNLAVKPVKATEGSIALFSGFSLLEALSVHSV